jgi:transcriptional regulator with PAS, ATPase and Fis domain
VCETASAQARVATHSCNTYGESTQSEGLCALDVRRSAARGVGWPGANGDHMPRRLLQRPSTLRLREFHGLYTTAPEMEACFRIIRRVAEAECTVLIVGESGTGKELIARALHAESGRRRAAFRAVNCATLSPTLLESELFGHVRGAFTGAVRDKPGLFTLADKGTLFFDEVAEIPLDLQGRLLRVLQEKSFLPVGGTRAVSVDVRVISATNKVLHEEVAAGRFREDLSYRIRVFPVYVPPLRDRSGDIEALVWHFVAELNKESSRRIKSISRAAMNILREYPWPGNVRELHSAIEYSFVVVDGPVLDVEHLTPDLRIEPLLSLGTARSPIQGDPERERLAAAMAKHEGRVGTAAAELGISRQTLWRKLYAYGLKQPRRSRRNATANRG